jgi:phage terminase large subunit
VEGTQLEDGTERRLIELAYQPREQFDPFHDRKQRWAVVVAHRRCGKTVACINDTIKRAIECPKPNPRYAYLAPTYAQAKEVVWGYLKQYAEPILADVNESELRVDLINGARIRLHGADNPDRLRGIYLDGIVLDEYASMKPSVWGEVIRPALSDRQGWATFIGTPKGRTGLWDIWEEARKAPDRWFRLMLKVSDTHILPEAELSDAKRTMTPEQYEQEYECSFEAAIIGAYYGRQMAGAETDKRICGVPYDPSALVYTAWDLGIRDATAIWFAQMVGREIHLIDFYEASGASLEHYVNLVRSKPYAYASHILPHDAQAKELGTGMTRLEVMGKLKLDPLRVCPIHRVEDGINAVRMKLPMMWFDANKCEQGISALKLYRAEWDENRKALKPNPVHDWSSHAADAMRYLCMALDRQIDTKAFNRKLTYPASGVA